MDQSTRLGGQLGFAKVCLDLAAGCGFPERVKLYPNEDPSFEVEVEYLNKPIVCTRCEIYGHDCDWRSKQGKKWVPKRKVEEEVAVEEEVSLEEAVSRFKDVYTHEGNQPDHSKSPGNVSSSTGAQGISLSLHIKWELSNEFLGSDERVIRGSWELSNHSAIVCFS
ncbi:unnamed protein product [Linum trigynum]|uniref:Uncharacterized protein n=1 Tax=Linum trigynum TaxID=586398 RepID=A0AAV2D8V8_9ROSI